MDRKPKVILVWYKRDLRVRDHRPLTEALALGHILNMPVVALYSFEPRVTEASDFSDFHRQFIADALYDLKYSLKDLGISLAIFERSISEVMKYLLSHYQIEQVFSHEETGNSITYQRDILMGQYLRAKNISWTEYPTNGVVRRLSSRNNWSSIWNARMTESILPTPRAQDAFESSLVSDDWHKPQNNSHIQKGWESSGHEVLMSFLQSRGRAYMGGMTRPIEGQSASSRLSPYLAYGCLSLREVVQATWSRMQEVKSAGDIRFLRSLQAFHSRLHWQSHFIQKLESEPRLETRNALALYDTIRTEYDEKVMSALEWAKTGIPFIDGTIRQLQTTGWINFRARATLVSFVVNTCMQPWSGRFAHWLARLFTDYEPGIHYPQLQMQSGTMGINTIRIYNPIKQLHDKDTSGRFVATWLPELADLPRHLQAEPWNISDMESLQYGFVLGRDYPRPIVDIEIANRQARKILYELRGKIDPVDKKQIVERHASRKKSPKKQSGKSRAKVDHAWVSENLALFE
jgi:deoxyribodipyrimidine photo-lyase